MPICYSDITRSLILWESQRESSSTAIFVGAYFGISGVKQFYNRRPYHNSGDAVHIYSKVSMLLHDSTYTSIGLPLVERIVSLKVEMGRETATKQICGCGRTLGGTTNKRKKIERSKEVPAWKDQSEKESVCDVFVCFEKISASVRGYKNCCARNKFDNRVSLLIDFYFQPGFNNPHLIDAI